MIRLSGFFKGEWKWHFRVYKPHSRELKRNRNWGREEWRKRNWEERDGIENLRFGEEDGMVVFRLCGARLLLVSWSFRGRRSGVSRDEVALLQGSLCSWQRFSAAVNWRSSYVSCEMVKLLTVELLYICCSAFGQKMDERVFFIKWETNCNVQYLRKYVRN